MRTTTLIILCGLGLLAGACGKKVKPPNPVIPDPPMPEGELILLDLGSGKLRVDDSGNAAATNANEIRFRRLAGGTTKVTTTDAVGEANSATAIPQDQQVDTCRLAVAELTQGQWETLVARTGAAVDPRPWSRVVGDGLGQAEATGSQIPAFGLSHEAIQAVCNAWNRNHKVQIRLPKHAEWVRAVRHETSAGMYAWGDSEDPTLVKRYARLAPDRLGLGPRSVPIAGESRALAGFYDLHGNVWEWVDPDGTLSAPALKGGSWNDLTLSARTDNQLAMDPTVPYVLAGCRLVVEVP